jgi:hypothetical protein
MISVLDFHSGLSRLTSLCYETHPAVRLHSPSGKDSRNNLDRPLIACGPQN